MDSNQAEQKPPSQEDGLPWLWATPDHRPRIRIRKSEYSLKGVRIEGSEATLTKETKEGTVEERLLLSEEAIDGVARAADMRSGKWLVFRDRSEIDSVWQSIARETVGGRLGVAAKVSTKFQQTQRHVICIYTNNYFDSEDVFSTRQKLRDLGIEDVLYYKPDIYTLLGIYSGTCSIRPWRYKE